MDIQLKRVYDPVEKSDGVRVLVDGWWPRGMTKERLRADLWLREAAPSVALRTWFHRDRSRWEEFRDRYWAELDGSPAVGEHLRDLASRGRVTLLFSARDPQHNQAMALRDYLLSSPQGPLGLTGSAPDSGSESEDRPSSHITN